MIGDVRGPYRMDDPQAKPARSRIPRFSLRTLVLLLLTLGLWSVLYVGRNPWEHTCTLTIPVPEEEIGIKSLWQCHVVEIRIGSGGKRLLAYIGESYTRKGLFAPLFGDRMCLWEIDPPALLLDKKMSPQIYFSNPPTYFFIMGRFSAGKKIVDGKGEWIIPKERSASDLETYLQTKQQNGVWFCSPAGTTRARQATVGSGRIEVQQRRRSPVWYGIIWLPEFYLTLLCAIGLIWSVWRDRRTVGTQQAVT